jgi:hypothetical protein
MKVQRQGDIKEKSKITATWLYEFAHDLEKGAYNNVDYLKQYFDSRQKGKGFDSIDEKMADIKDRVGFDLARKISEEVNKNNKVTASNHSSCECSTPKTACGCKIKQAEYKHPEEDVRLMGNILSYVKDMVKHEPYLDRATIISKCRDEEELGFGRLSINQDKFKSFVDDLLSSNKSKNSSELVSYIPNEPFSESDANDWEAEYYKHSKPEG